MPAPCLVLLDTVLIRVFVVSTVLMVAVGQALAIFTWVAVSEATAQERSTPVFALVLLLAILTSAFILFIPIARRCLHVDLTDLFDIPGRVGIDNHVNLDGSRRPR